MKKIKLLVVSFLLAGSCTCVGMPSLGYTLSCGECGNSEFTLNCGGCGMPVANVHGSGHGSPQAH